MNGAFSGAVDIPTRFCFAVNKASKRKCACPPCSIVRFSPGKYVIVRLGWGPYTCRR